MMRIGVLIVLVFLMVPAAAQAASAVPQSREQVQLTFAPLVKQIAPAVVNIYTSRIVTSRASPFMGDPFFEQFFGRSFGAPFGFGGGLPRQRVESALGSGLIVDAAGLVVTNAHVIEGADEVTIGLSDGREFAADILVVDAPSDLAVLRVDPGGERLPYAALKPSESLAVGDLVLAIGNPFGVGQTVTSGIVSALARSSLNINDFNFFIQTDAAINPGNSGGPLVAMDGHVVGINTAIFSRSGGSLGIGFAIPSEMVVTVIAAARAGQTAAGGSRGIIRPWLGVSVQAVTADIADSLDFDVPAGVLIAGLHDASPAKKAGLKVGDVVLAVNDREIRAPEEMKFRMATIPLGEKARFTVLRDGREQTVMVEAMGPPEEPPRNETVLSGGHPFNGVTVAQINPAVAVELGIADEQGVVVTGVSGRTQAVRLTRPGDIIVAVNGDEIADIDDLERELGQGGRRGWDIILRRDGHDRRIVLR